ncbi:isoprenoid biosynthesis glyoxalase ElbB [Dasania marina]|uniref:isoprenoid biosynthesis glyoxalase ElbB n=1 Tax=Dasania marina TaxID=471499 RepID=UPI0003717800|nr:isoprenoid biosynthesis glyoxalase ElbB [Dasania marina]|tara:strand:- start:74802 stop:75455 length:654 start_codon:yes stop_codon:yes gene_type:complete
MKKVAVVLAGCGVYDGAEINEAVLTLLSLEQEGAAYQCFAPDMAQMHVVNHLSGEVSEGETRNVLVEAARITRGNVQPLTEAKVDDFDALIVPGGFGAAKNLSDFAVKGTSLTVQADFLSLAQAMHAAKKPVGLLCITPTLSAAIFGAGVKCTIGNDAEVAGAINAMGGEHVDCGVEHSIVDSKNKLVTTPAYMLAGSVLEAYKGIHNCVKNVLAMA